MKSPCAIFVLLNLMLVPVFSEKRLVLQGEVDIAEELRKMNQSLAEMKAELLRLQSLNGGVTYVRWGRAECAGNGSELVYKGYIGGSLHTAQGGGTNTICLTDTPEWGSYMDGNQNLRSNVYGTEIDDLVGFTDKAFGYNADEQDVPCAVCNSQRSRVLMVPGRKSCMPGWTLEYTGYLMAGYGPYVSSQYLCMDGKPEFLQHGGTNDNQHILYFTESRCGSLPCPPYVEGRELVCAVCTK